MRIQLKKLTMHYFKGICDLEIEFGPGATDIFGENGAGKTTIKDALLWLLFGKDSSDRKDFEVKTLDENNRAIERLDHEVTGHFDLDGEDLVISRVYREKWVKRRGATTAEFSGHETTYFWNEVPCNEKEFQSKVNGILDENIFKLITNTGYFNQLKWQDRRTALLGLAGEISNREIAERNPELFEPILAALGTKKTLDELRLQIAAQKKKIKEELEHLPARIDEAKRAIRDDLDFDTIVGELDSLKADMDMVESMLSNKSLAEKQRQEQLSTLNGKVFELQQAKQTLAQEVKSRFQDAMTARLSAISEKRRSLGFARDEIARIHRSIHTNTALMETYEKERNDLREQFARVDAGQPDLPPAPVFNDRDFACPTCKRAYEASDIESKKSQMMKNYEDNKERILREFNEGKARKIAAIRAQGVKKNEEIALLQETIAKLQSEYDVLAAQVKELSEALQAMEMEHNHAIEFEAIQVEKMTSESPEWSRINAEIEAIQKQIEDLGKPEVNSGLLGRKKDLQVQIDARTSQLAFRDLNAKAEARVRELEEKEAKLAAELAEEEGKEFAITEFNRAKMETLVERINGKFRLVTWKMFEQQINGGISECCECLINGVPYSDANNASRINAGIDIINAFQEHYGIYAPVFIDNAESINRVMPVAGQLIRLVVSKDKKLRIETEARMAKAV